MKTLKPIDDNALDFANNLILNKRKNKEEYLFALMKIKKYFDNYENAYKVDNLEKFANVNENDNDCILLSTLYSYKSKVFKDLRNRVLTYNGRIHSTCPLCGLSEAKTLDHFLPKTPFPEFSIEPRNLIPICNCCNSKKSDIWHSKNNHRQFWNSYLNELPKTNFLKCNISFEDDMPIAKYSIEQGEMGINQFNLISSTFMKLDLCNRYNEKADEWIEQLKNNIMPLKKDFTLYNIREYVKEAFKYYDINDAQKVLNYALVENNDSLLWLTS